MTQIDVVQRLEWRTLDWRTNARVPFQPGPDPRIAVILYEDSTETNLTSWPPDRAVHGDLIKLLTLARPAVIAWDVILDASREGEGDAAMARAAGMAGRAGIKVITASVTNPEPVKGADPGLGPTQPLKDVTGDIRQLLGDDFALLPYPALRQQSYYGFADTPPGADGLRREIPLVVRVGSDVFPSLALQIIMTYFEVSPARVRVRLGDAVYLPTERHGELRLPISSGGRFLLNYRYDQDEYGADFPLYSYLEALLKLTGMHVDKDPHVPSPPRLEGKIVFIGQTVTAKADVGPTPRNPSAPLVFVHANLVNNVLANDFARTVSPWPIWLAAVALGHGGLVLGLRRPLSVLVVFSVLTVIAYVSVALWCWIEFSLWLPLVAPLAGFVALQFAVIARRLRQEQRAREQVKKMFGSYLSPVLLEKMMKTGRGVSTISSERRAVTILFSDLRDFTSLTESMRDDLLIQQLNEYLAAMVECIHQEGGTLHKFIGDAVMAVWGDLGSDGPVVDAGRAARAALAMQAKLAELNRRWQSEERPALRMGIGLNHGLVLIGNIGSPRRMEFTAIGDAVNLASRLESLSKSLKADIVVGENLRALLGDDFALLPRGEVPVKGKAKPVSVYELRPSPVAGGANGLN